MDDSDGVLAGGNASGEVLRIGPTVRKPWIANTPVVHAFMEFLRARGVDAPAPIGRDAEGRQVLEFVPGADAQQLMPLDEATLRAVGAQVRRLHDVSESFDIQGLDATATLLPVSSADLMCHNDLAPWNLVIGDRTVFIDWDGAGPSTRLWDLAYCAQSFGLLAAGEPVGAAASRLRAFVNGYGADETLRAALPDAMTTRTRAMFEMLQRSNRDRVEPWSTMFAQGHGEFWREASEYVQAHRSAWATALASR